MSAATRARLRLESGRLARGPLNRNGQAPPAKIQGFAMATLPARIPPQRRFAWLLWIMLLLPLAQGAANWHAVSHAAQELGAATQDESRDPLLPQTGHCDLCLTAAAIHGGALPSAPVFLPHPPAPHEAPQTALAGVWPGSPAPVYRSRAPPALSH